MHGGGINFSRRRWAVEAADASSALLRLDSPAGDQRFPGSLTAWVAYNLTDADELLIGALLVAGLAARDVRAGCCVDGRGGNEGRAGGLLCGRQGRQRGTCGGAAVWTAGEAARDVRGGCCVDGRGGSEGRAGGLLCGKQGRRRGRSVGL